MNETESTNSDQLQRILDGLARHGDVLVASRQSGGRGRDGRQWMSSLGGLYVSLVLERTLNPTLYPLWAALCVKAALQDHNVSIKWPNDLLIGEKKVGGILCECAQDFVIIGIGVNVDVVESNLLPEACSLHGVSVDGVLRSILDQFTLPQTSTSIVDQYNKECATLGHNVYLRDGTHGRAVRVNGNGALEIETAQGVQQVDTPTLLKDNVC